MFKQLYILTTTIVVDGEAQPPIIFFADNESDARSILTRQLEEKGFEDYEWPTWRNNVTAFNRVEGKPTRTMICKYQEHKFDPDLLEDAKRLYSVSCTLEHTFYFTIENVEADSLSGAEEAVQELMESDSHKFLDEFDKDSPDDMDLSMDAEEDY